MILLLSGCAAEKQGDAREAVTSKSAGRNLPLHKAKPDRVLIPFVTSIYSERAKGWDNYCYSLQAVSYYVVAVRANNLNFSTVIRDFETRIKDPAYLAEVTSVARTVWDDRTTSVTDIPAKSEKDCRSAHGLSNTQKPKRYKASCEFLAREAFLAMIGYFRDGSSLEEVKTDFVNGFRPGVTRQYFIRLAEIYYINPSARTNEFYQIALDACRADPLIGEIQQN